jgi:hypothetical protein
MTVTNRIVGDSSKLLEGLAIPSDCQIKDASLSQRSVTMKRIYITLALLLSSLIILAGCCGKMRYPNYNTLNFLGAPDPPVAERAKATVAIREFRSPACLRRGSIVHQDEAALNTTIKEKSDGNHH